MRTEFSLETWGHWRKSSGLICFTFLILVCPAHSFLWPLSLEQRSLVKWTPCWVGKCLRLTITLVSKSKYESGMAISHWTWHEESPPLLSGSLSSLENSERKLHILGSNSPTPTPTSMPSPWAQGIETWTTSPSKSGRGKSRGYYSERPVLVRLVHTG